MNEPAITFHLTPIEVWRAQIHQDEYLPEAFAADGFIHCTDGEALVIDVGNRYYTADSRDFCLLYISVSDLTSRVVYEDPSHVYPHIYGPLNIDAVVDVRAIERTEDGRFLHIGRSLDFSNQPVEA